MMDEDSASVMTREAELSQKLYSKKSRVEGVQAGKPGFLLLTKEEGESLEQAASGFQKEQGIVSPCSEAMRLMLADQLLSDVVRIHQLGYVHGDLKPGNVMIEFKEKLMVHTIDYGGAKQVGLEGVGLDGTFKYWHPQAVQDYKEEGCLQTHFDNVGLACCLCIILGWGNPSDDANWALKVRDTEDYEDLDRGYILPQAIIKKAADNSAALRIITKLLASSSDSDRYYAAEQALKEMKPLLRTSFLVPSLYEAMESIENEIAQYLLEDGQSKRALLYELKQILYIPKGATAEFLEERGYALDEFLLDNEQAFKTLALDAFKNSIIQQLLASGILSAKKHISGLVNQIEAQVVQSKVSFDLKNLTILDKVIGRLKGQSNHQTKRRDILYLAKEAIQVTQKDYKPRSLLGRLFGRLKKFAGSRIYYPSQMKVLEFIKQVVSKQDPAVKKSQNAEHHSKH